MWQRKATTDFSAVAFIVVLRLESMSAGALTVFFEGELYG